MLNHLSINNKLIKFQFITNLLSSAGTYVLQLGTGVITNATGFAISTLTTIMLSIYFLKDKEILISSI